MRCLIVVVVAACGFRASGARPEADAGGSIDAPGCPAGYVQLAGLPSRYRVSGGPGTTSDPQGRGTWVMAEADCRRDGVGAHLAIAETKAEHNAFVDVVSGASRWLGVTDRTVEGTWRADRRRHRRQLAGSAGPARRLAARRRRRKR